MISKTNKNKNRCKKSTKKNKTKLNSKNNLHKN